MNNINTVGIKRIYIDRKGVATIVCERCGKLKKFTGINTQMKLNPVMVRCSCGNQFRVIFDERKHYRRQVLLKGHIEVPGYNRRYPIIVENISLGGVLVRSPHVTTLKPADLVKVDFALDNAEQSFISRTAVVRHIHGYQAGLEFVHDKYYDKELGFYLRR